MAKSTLVEVNKKIEKRVIGGYKKIEDGVVSSYKKIEEGAVGGFQKVAGQICRQFSHKRRGNCRRSKGKTCSRAEGKRESP